jgi:hypothetical protein
VRLARGVVWDHPPVGPDWVVEDLCEGGRQCEGCLGGLSNQPSNTVMRLPATCLSSYGHAVVVPRVSPRRR